MSTYAIGDIQGCQTEVERLLDAIAFDPRHDRLWLLGDLVNRGPRSLDTLRWAMGLGDAVTVVLGNHDVHLLALAGGAVSMKARHLAGILGAPDREALIEWLRHRPFAHFEHGYLAIHAGLLPEWALDDVLAAAGEIETELRGPRWVEFLASTYTKPRYGWAEASTPALRRQLALATLTRGRLLTTDGRLDFAYKGTLPAPEGLSPWFERSPVLEQTTVLCGHWAAIGLRVQAGLLALDTGCVWGGELTAFRLDDGRVFQVEAAT